MNHLSTLRKRKQSAIPPVAASEQGSAQTGGVQAQERCVAGVVGRRLGRLNGPGSYNNDALAEVIWKVLPKWVMAP